jgi:hypothetical protein
MVGLYYVIQEMGIFPMSAANNFCDMPLPKYIDSKTVLIYRPHPVSVPSKSKKQKTDLKVSGTDPRILIRTKMSRMYINKAK